MKKIITMMIIFHLLSVSLFAQTGNVLSLQKAIDRPIPKIIVGLGNVSSTTIAMYEGKEEIEVIKALISRGINATNDNGYTPLILASSYGYTELIKELIATGANIDAKSYEGYNCLRNCYFA